MSRDGCLFDIVMFAPEPELSHGNIVDAQALECIDIGPEGSAGFRMVLYSMTGRKFVESSVVIISYTITNGFSKIIKKTIRYFSAVNYPAG